MKNPVTTLFASATVLLLSAMSWFAGSQALRAEDVGASWNPSKAAAYLDSRAVWWSEWSGAARDHGTYCISCHTTLPFALARPRLRAVLHETRPSTAEGRIMDNLLTRVKLGRDAEPFYPDQTRGIPKTSESRAIEAVMNALVLARRDAEVGTLSAEAKVSLDAMWALQMKVGTNAGAWTWLNFNYEPWESANSPYLGASLAALAVGAVPAHYAESPDLQGNIAALRAYFQKQFPNESTLNRLMALWASSGVTDLLTAEQRKITVDEAFAKQQPDGGWATALLGTYQRVDKTPLDPDTDGYATGLATLALQAASVSADDPRVARGLAWLRRHQNPDTGEWSAASLNKQRDPKSDPAKFMGDAATAYAVLALTYKAPASTTSSR